MNESCILYIFDDISKVENMNLLKETFELRGNTFWITNEQLV